MFTPTTLMIKDNQSFMPQIYYAGSERLPEATQRHNNEHLKKFINQISKGTTINKSLASAKEFSTFDKIRENQKQFISELNQNQYQSHNMSVPVVGLNK